MERRASNRGAAEDEDLLTSREEEEALNNSEANRVRRDSSGRGEQHHSNTRRGRDPLEKASSPTSRKWDSSVFTWLPR
jgi:hypothetical protein